MVRAGEVMRFRRRALREAGNRQAASARKAAADRQGRFPPRRSAARTRLPAPPAPATAAASRPTLCDTKCSHIRSRKPSSSGRRTSVCHRPGQSAHAALELRAQRRRQVVGLRLDIQDHAIAAKKRAPAETRHRRPACRPESAAPVPGAWHRCIRWLRRSSRSGSFACGPKPRSASTDPCRLLPGGRR